MEQTGEDPSLLFALHQQLRARDFWTRQQLEEHQSYALEALRTYAYTHSPFYQRFHQGLTDRPLHELPVLTKAIVMESFDDLVTDHTIRRRDVETHMETMRLGSRFLQRYLTLSTSGSTGRRGVFLFSDGDWHVLLASYLRAMEDWTNLAHDGEHPIRTAAVSSSTPWHPSASVNASLHSRFFPMFSIDATTLIDMMVEQLNNWQPELFIGYPSSLHALAQEQLAGRLQIAPHAIIASSEVVVEHQRRRMQAAWGNEIFTMYGTTEGGCVAMECDQHAGLHLFEDLLIVEVVDQDNQPVPAGVYGDKVLITVLFNYTQPLIRYQLDDRVRLSSALCSCGRPYRLLDSIEGRLEHVLYFPTPDGDQRAVHPNVFHRVLEHVPCTGWKVVQEARELRILLSGTPADFVDDALMMTLQKELEAQAVLVPPIVVQQVASIPRTRSGKVSLITTAREDTGKE